MEITTILRPDGLRIRSVKGVLDIHKLFQELSQLYSQADHHPDYNVLWDMREADCSQVTLEGVENIRKTVQQNWGTGGTSKAALLVQGDLEFGYARMFEMLTEADCQSSVMVFKEYETALAWLETGEKM